MTFDQALLFVLKWEGGVSNDPYDAGKLTKFGVSEIAYPQVRNADFSQDDAKAIYLSDFWNRFHCGEMPGGVDLMMFDMGVNQTQQAARIMQYALGVTADGLIGPQTLQAINAGPADKLINELVARRAFVYSANPLVSRDGLGWYRRLAACHHVALVSALDSKGA